MGRLYWGEFTEEKYDEMVEAIHARDEDSFEYYALPFYDYKMEDFQLEINPVALGSEREWAVDITLFDGKIEDYDGSVRTGYYEEDIPTYEEFKAAAEALAEEAIEKYEDKVVDKDVTPEQLADEIEQYMFERGEYDFGSDDRIRWLENVPDAYDVAKLSPSELNDIRETVTKNIQVALDEPSTIQPLINYFNDEAHELDEEDDLNVACGRITDKLCDLAEQSKVYTVSAYYDGDYKGLAANEYFKNWSNVEEFAHEQLMQGSFVRIDNNEDDGKSVKISPDEYQSKFDGEFIYKASDLEASVITPFMDVIRDMDAGEHFTIESPVEGAVMVITKDPDFVKNRIIMETDLSETTNNVTVDFQVNNKSVANTVSINVSDLETALTRIANDDTTLFVNKDKTLKDLVNEANSPKNKKVELTNE